MHFLYIFFMLRPPSCLTISPDFETITVEGNEMTAKQLAREIAERRGGKAFASYRQAAWLQDLLDREPDAETTDGREFFIADGDDALHVNFAHDCHTAKIEILEGFEARRNAAQA